MGAGTMWLKLALLCVVQGLVVRHDGGRPVRSPRRAEAGGEGERLRAEIARLELKKKVATLRAEIRADEAAFAEVAAADATRRASRDAARAAERDAKRAAKAAAADATKRNAVLRQCLDANATEVSLILLNDPVTKRARVLEVLTEDLRLPADAAEKIMLRAHRSGAGVVRTWARDDLDDAWGSYAKLTAAGLDARFEAVAGADAEDLERIAELRDLGAQLRDYNIDILNEDETDLNFPTTVALNAAVALFAGAAFSLAWTLGADIGAIAGETLTSGDVGAFAAGEPLL